MDHLVARALCFAAARCRPSERSFMSGIEIEIQLCCGEFRYRPRIIQAVIDETAPLAEVS